MYLFIILYIFFCFEIPSMSHTIRCEFEPELVWDESSTIPYYGISHQSQVVVCSLLLHRCMLGKVDEVGADGLWIRLHVDGLESDIRASGKLHNKWLGWHDVPHGFSPFYI